MIVELVDGTYELFRHFYGLRRFNKGEDAPFGAVVGVLQTVLQMIEGGSTHIGVATDHVIKSFRNDIWPGYKTGEGIEPLKYAISEMVAAHRPASARRRAAGRRGRGPGTGERRWRCCGGVVAWGTSGAGLQRDRHFAIAGGGKAPGERAHRYADGR